MLKELISFTKNKKFLWNVFLSYTRTFEQKAGIIFILILIINCIAFVLAHAPHNNYTTYNTGTLNFFNGIDPYPSEWRQSLSSQYLRWFLYHPSFCVFFFIFSTDGLGMYAGAYSWLILNLLIFWIGFLSLMDLLDSKTGYLKGRWFFLVLILMFNEVQAPLLNHHVNSFVSGLMMLGVAAYMRRNFALSAFFLSVGVTFKILPIVVVLLLFLEFNRKFISCFLGFLFFIFLMPLLFISFDFYFEIIRHWLTILLTEPLHNNYLGLQPTLAHFGWEAGSVFFSIFMMINALAIALAAYKVFYLSGREDFIRLLFPLAVLFLLIFNKRTETPTFVFMAPLYAFMLHAVLHEKQRNNFGRMWVNVIALSVGWLLVTYVYTDLYPYDFRQIARNNHIKTFGLLVMYVWSWAQVFTNNPLAHIENRI